MKGFTHTLEAIIGSILLLSSIAIITPVLQTETEVEQPDVSINAEVSRKIDEISINEAENEIRPLLPVGYNQSAFIRRTDTKTVTLQASGGTDNHYLNRSGEAVFLHLFSEGTGHNVTYRGEDVIKNGESGYKSFRHTNTSGYLNLSGDAFVKIEAVNQSIVGTPRLDKNIDTYNFPKYNQSPAEVKVSVWK